MDQIENSAESRKRLEVTVADGVVTVRLVHPPLNIIDLATARELVEELAKIEASADISAVVFTSSGRLFSAGVDIKAHVPEQIHELLTTFHAAIRAIVGSRKVTLASVRGACLGGAAELAMVCDIVYTARDATWGFPEIKLGCYPPVAAVALPALIGQKRASELILTGRQISGDEAATMGLATRCARSDQLPGLIAETVTKLARLSPVTLALTKKGFYAWDAIHFDKGLARAEKIYLEELVSTADAREGIMAYLEKRTPEWTKN